MKSYKTAFTGVKGEHVEDYCSKHGVTGHLQHPYVSSVSICLKCAEEFQPRPEIVERYRKAK